jgi:DNA-binding SARP family transcriptional activator
MWLNKIPRGAGDWPNWAKTLYHLQLMLIALIYKDYHNALRQGKTALDYATSTGSRMSVAHVRVLLSQTLHFLGKEDESLQELEEVRVYARQRGSGLFSSMLFMNEALFSFDREDTDEGFRFLRLALENARESGHLLTPLDNPVVTTDLCIKALEAGIEIEYVREIVRRRGLIAEKSPVHIANWPWKVKIYALGRFGIVKDDGRLPSSRKSQQTPLRLLKALISLGGRDIAEEMITAHLWPDSEGDLAHRSFTVTLHRLRKLLGNADALRLSDGKLTLDNRYCWVDTWAFERLLGQAEECRRQGNHGTALEFVSKALDLYRGGFLAGEREESWAVSPAERLRAKFLKGTSWLGEHFEKIQDWDGAAVHYEKCLTADDCSETIYRRLMVCYTNLNRISDALTVYGRCRKVLNSVLSIPPGVETEAIRSRLLQELKSQNL